MNKLFSLCLILSIGTTGFSQSLVKMRECVIDGGVLKEIEIDYNPATGDRTILFNGVRKNFNDVYPTLTRDYSGGQAWYINNETVLFEGRPFVKYGLPRILGTGEISKAGLYKGVGVYAETGLSGPPEVIYIPVRQGCEFQPYQLNCGSVRIQRVNSTSSLMQFSARTEGMTGKQAFNWEVTGARIIKGQGTGNIIVDVKNKKDGESFELSVTALDAKKCPVTDFEEITISKPSEKNKTSSNWKAGDRKKFMETCVPSTKLGKEKGSAYCTCMLAKIEVLYPDPALADKELKQEAILDMAKDCLKTKN